MGCSCNKGKTGEPSSYQVRKADGTVVAYRTQVEAKAAASRMGGKCQNCS